MRNPVIISSTSFTTIQLLSLFFGILTVFNVNFFVIFNYQNTHANQDSMFSAIKDHELVNLIQQCIHKDPAKRITASQAISHSFFHKVEYFSSTPIPPAFWEIRNLEQHQINKVDVTQEMKEKMQEIMNSSTVSSDLGIGRDVKEKDKYTKLVIHKVERIENTQLWDVYANKKSNFERRLIYDLNNNNNNHQLKRIKTVIEREWMQRDYQINDKINEKYLWTGTKPENVPLIIQQGAEERVASLRGLFGAGIYLAEYASKSDQYLVSDSNGNCYMFLCRVLMGDAYVVEKYPPRDKGVRRIQDIPEVATKLNSNELKTVPDSLLAECRRTGHPNADLERYREMVLYDRAQVYPEFLVTLKRQ